MALVIQLGDGVVSGMCSVLSFSINICHCACKKCFCPFLFYKVFKRGIDKSDESLQYQHVLAICASFFFNKGDIC